MLFLTKGSYVNPLVAHLFLCHLFILTKDLTEVFAHHEKEMMLSLQCRNFPVIVDKSLWLEGLQAVIVLGCFSLNGKSVSVKVFLKSEVFMQYTSSCFSLMVISFYFFLEK